MSGGIFDGHNRGEEVLLACRGQRPGMLLNFLQRTGQPTTKVLQPQMSVVLRNPGLTCPMSYSPYNDPRRQVS